MVTGGQSYCYERFGCVPVHSNCLNELLFCDIVPQGGTWSHQTALFHVWSLEALVGHLVLPFGHLVLPFGHLGLPSGTWSFLWALGASFGRLGLPSGTRGFLRALGAVVGHLGLPSGTWGCTARDVQSFTGAVCGRETVETPGERAGNGRARAYSSRPYRRRS